MSERSKEREIEIDRQTLHGKIRRAKYKKRYKEIEPRTQLPGYLWAGEKKGMQRPKARAGCGNLDENNRYWESEGARK